MATDFRADVQGLRAVAVLTVVAAHAGVPFLPGGYVGVDVFFVISGYLIAGLLFREVDREGTFSLSSFWSRRARRILPAATLVTAVTVVFSLFWMSLIDTRQVATDAVWSSFFAANVHFAQQGIYYFAQDTGPSPLQHYWSLAVEEQFYVVWPLLLLGCLALAGRRYRPTGRRLPRGVVLAVLLVVGGASFAWSVHQSVAQPGTAYFSTFTRAWELAVGALAALVPAAATRRIGRVTGTVLAVLGLAAIGTACVRFTPETVFPGYAAALPVAGATLLLLGGAGERRPLTSALLTNPPMRVIGDWSYSMYLWHWPALVLTERLLGRSLEPWERAVAVALVLALAGLSYRFVEEPFRAGRGAHAAFTTPKALLLYPLSITLVASTVTAATYWTAWKAGELTDNPPIAAPGTAGLGAGDHDDAVALVRASVAAARDQFPIPSDLDPELLELRSSIADVGRCDYSEDVRLLCPRGAEDGYRTVVVIGDSHARAWIPAFDKITVEGGWKAYYLVKSQCTAAHVTTAPLDEERPFTECDDFHDWVETQVDALQPDLVIVASSPPVNGVYDGERRVTSTEATAPLLAEGYDDLFADLNRSADRVVLLRDVPKSADDPGTCLTSGDADLGDCMFSPVERSTELADVAVAAARRAGADVVDPTPWLCYQGECPVVIGGTLSYRDTDHLTTEYAASLSGPLGLALDMVDP